MNEQLWTLLPTIENLVSALSLFPLILATLSSLRAASRLEQRWLNNGSIGLMDGPPILGPWDAPISSKANDVKGAEDYSNSSIQGEEETISDRNNESNNNEPKIFEASPLWDHAEAFRYAALLGLIFDGLDRYDYSMIEHNDVSSNNARKSKKIHNSPRIFSKVIKDEGKSNILVKGKSEELSIAAAVAAGLLVSNEQIVRGGGYASRTPQASTKVANLEAVKEVHNPISAVSSWFYREISAPFAAIPAWQGMVCSFFREQRENNDGMKRISVRRVRHWLSKCLCSERVYDPTKWDLDAYTSGIVHIPCVGSKTDSSINCRAVCVKAYAPKTFQDLRNRCFLVKETEYAQSILNLFGCGDSNDAIYTELLKKDEVKNRVTLSSENESIMTNDCPVELLLLNEVLQSKQPGFTTAASGTRPYISFQSNSKGAARAGTFFFFTADGAYMIKSVKKEEAKAFLAMLPEYHRFMSNTVNGRNSLLTRVFGLYSVKFLVEDAQNREKEKREKWNGGLFCPNGEPKSSISSTKEDEQVFLVMNSVFPAEASSFLTERFDLKGSTVGRECSLEERTKKGVNAVLKDLDLKREVDESISQSRKLGYGIHVGIHKKSDLLAQIRRDVALLNKCGVLDYSLLVGIGDLERTKSTMRSRTCTKDPVLQALKGLFHWIDCPMPYFDAGQTKVDGGKLSNMRGTRKGKDVNYYFGVIDFLQPWTLKKRLERDLKGMAGYDTSAISCVAPSDYASRFLKFLDTHIT